MRYAHIYSRITNTPWFVDESTLVNITRLLEQRMNHGPVADLPATEKQPHIAGAYSVENGDAIIPLFGIIGKHLSTLETMCGGVDLNVLRTSFDAANRDPSVQRIVFHVDSPGGVAVGNHELHTHIRSSKTKPVLAYTEGKNGSAAYYVTAAADNIGSSPTGYTGSIGSYCVVKDVSAQLAMQGVSLRVIRSGQFKGQGADGHVTEELVANLQAEIDYLGAQFRADMSEARPRILADDMQGRAYFAEEARAKGYIDVIASTLEDYLELTRNPTAG